jgi:hypothetical protein
MHIPTNFQTAGPFNLGGGEIVELFMVALFVAAVWWLPPRIARASGEGLRGDKRSTKDSERREDPSLTRPPQ